jgi:hypothetical protein
VNALEDRLRTELRAESRLIAEGTIPALSLPGQDGHRAAGRGRPAPGLVRRGAAPRRWPGWLAPLAAAAAVVGVIIASLAISGLIGRGHAGSGPANPSSVYAKVPRYFVAIPEVSGRAVVGATATGAVLETVAPPKPHEVFTWVAAAGDGRTFVLGASPRLRRGEAVPAPRPVTFYRLALGRSGHPGRLVPLPIPTETAIISGLALSPDGSKLAVTYLPPHGQTGSKIEVFSLATGAGREWVWPGRGTIGSVVIEVGSGGLQWEADNRTLMFELTTRTSDGWPAQLYLLDTATPGGSLLASSRPIPVPTAELGLQHNRKRYIVGMPLITGDGTKLVASFYHQEAPPKVFGFTITEFSVRTGKPIKVLYQKRTGTEAASTAAYWVNTHGTAMIAVRGPVFGIQTPTSFTPLPPSTQRLFTRPGPMGVGEALSRLPAW